MPTKKILELPDAPTPDPAHILHIGAGGVDYKITLANLEGEFGKVDIFGMTPDSTPTGADIVATGDGTATIANNRKVTLDNLSGFMQDPAQFATTATLAAADKLVMRVDSVAGQTEITAQNMKNYVLDFSTGISGDASPHTSDLFAFYDVSLSTNKNMTTSQLRDEMFRSGGLSTVTSIGGSDLIYFLDGSTPRMITWDNFTSGISGGPGGDVTEAGTNDFTGTNTFSNGFSTNVINRFNSQTTLTVNHPTVAFNSTISGTTVSFGTIGKSAGDSNIRGLFTGSYGIASSYLDIKNYSGAKHAEVSGINSLRPKVDGGADLGSSDKYWDNGYIENLWVKSNAQLPDTVKIGTAASATSIWHSTNNQFLSAVIPNGTTSGEGGLRIASEDQANKGLGGTNPGTAAITASVLGSLVKNSVSPVTLNMENDNQVDQGYNATLENYGSIEIGSLVVNWGTVLWDQARNSQFQVYMDLESVGTQGVSIFKKYDGDPAVTGSVLTSTKIASDGVTNVSSTGSTLRIGAGNSGDAIKGFTFIAIGKGLV